MARMGHSGNRGIDGNPQEPMVILHRGRLRSLDEGAKEHAGLLEAAVLRGRANQLNCLGDPHSGPDQKPAFLQQLPGDRLLRSLVLFNPSTGEEEPQGRGDHGYLSPLDFDDRVRARTNDVLAADYALTEHWHIVVTSQSFARRERARHADDSKMLAPTSSQSCPTRSKASTAQCEHLHELDIAFVSTAPDDKFLADMQRLEAAWSRRASSYSTTAIEDRPATNDRVPRQPILFRATTPPAEMALRRSRLMRNRSFGRNQGETSIPDIVHEE